MTGNPWNLHLPVRVVPTGVRVRLLDPPKPKPTTPWGLLPSEMEVLTMLVELGTIRAVAVKTGRSANTIKEQCRTAKIKMKAKSNIEAVLMWDRRERD